MREADCVVLLTAHRQFLEQPLWEYARLIVDTRNVVPAGPNVTPHLAGSGLMSAAASSLR